MQKQHSAMILEMLQNDRVVRSCPLPDGDFEKTIGRAGDIATPNDDKTVSRIHAKLVRRGDRVTIFDMQSTHGTWCGDSRIVEPIELRDDGSVRIGRLHLRIGGAKPSVDVQVEENSRLFEEPSVAQAAQAEQVALVASERRPPVSRDVAHEDPPSVAFADMGDEFRNADVLYTDECMALKRKIHSHILEEMKLSEDSHAKLADAKTKKKLNACVDSALREFRHEIPRNIEPDVFRQALMDEIDGYGPISPILRSPTVTEVMVNGPNRIFIERAGKLMETGVRFFDEAHLIQIIQRIVSPLGRHVDEQSPMVDARLPDGSRVNAVIPPLALDGASLTIRKFSEKKLTTEDLVRFGSLTPNMAEFLKEAVRVRKNILVSGGTGSGKTTLLNILSQFIPRSERVVTVEDSAELKLSHRNIVRLEARPANTDGKGRVTIRDLVINCLRMRPDRIIVGECRGAEALDMLQAMNTGHDGSLTTAHANSPRDALARLENMVMMAGFELPSSAIREQIASAIDIIVQQTRLPDGTRKIVNISVVAGRESNTILLQDVFVFQQTGIGPGGKVLGCHKATGSVPQFIEDLEKSGALQIDRKIFETEGEGK